jgi:hypothetical protein
MFHISGLWNSMEQSGAFVLRAGPRQDMFDMHVDEGTTGHQHRDHDGELDPDEPAVAHHGG